MQESKFFSFNEWAWGYIGDGPKTGIVFKCKECKGEGVKYCDCCENENECKHCNGDGETTVCPGSLPYNFKDFRAEDFISSDLYVQHIATTCFKYALFHSLTPAETTQKLGVTLDSRLVSVRVKDTDPAEYRPVKVLCIYMANYGRADFMNHETKQKWVDYATK